MFINCRNLFKFFSLCLIIQALGSSVSLASSVSGKKVRLLFPVERGTELDLLSDFVNSPKLYSIDGKSYVLAAELPDAVIAFRLGKTIQSKLKLPFVLAYDLDHPQSNLLWMQAELDSSKQHIGSTNYKPKNSSIAMRPKLSYVKLAPAFHVPGRLTGVAGLSGQLPSRAKFNDCFPVEKCLPSLKISNPLLPLKTIGSGVANFSDSGSSNNLSRPLPVFAAASEPKRSQLSTSSSLDPSPDSLLFTRSRLQSSEVSKLATFPSNLQHSLLSLTHFTPKEIAANSIPGSSRSARPPVAHERSLADGGEKKKSLQMTSDSDPQSLFLSKQNIFELSPVGSFAFSDPSLVFVFVRLSDFGQASLLVKNRSPQAFYQVDKDLYAQLAVFSSSRLGKQALDARLDALSQQGLNPIALTSRQFLSLASSFG